MQQTTMHLNPSSTFPFLRSTGMTARHSNPKAKEKKKFLFDPFLFIHVWTTGEKLFDWKQRTRIDQEKKVLYSKTSKFP